MVTRADVNYYVDYSFKELVFEYAGWSVQVEIFYFGTSLCSTNFFVF